MKRQYNAFRIPVSDTGNFPYTHVHQIRRLIVGGVVLCVSALLLFCLASCQTTQKNEPFVNTTDRSFDLVPFVPGSDAEYVSNDGMIIFANSGGLSSGIDIGHYTECHFDIVGEGVERFDVEMSKGSLDAVVSEVYIELSAERALDYATSMQWPNTEIYWSEDEAYQSALAKLGGTDDQKGRGPRSSGGVSADDLRVTNFTIHRALGDSFSYQPETVDKGTGIDFSQAKLSFRLTVEDMRSLGELTPSDWLPIEVVRDYATLDLFDGSLLTVTAHFDDGTAARKIYQLNTGWLKHEFQNTYADDGTVEETDHIILPELATEDKAWQRQSRIDGVYSLYAVELT